MKPRAALYPTHNNSFVGLRSLTISFSALSGRWGRYAHAYGIFPLFYWISFIIFYFICRKQLKDWMFIVFHYTKKVFSPYQWASRNTINHKGNTFLPFLKRIVFFSLLDRWGSWMIFDLRTKAAVFLRGGRRYRRAFLIKRRDY